MLVELSWVELYMIKLLSTLGVDSGEGFGGLVPPPKPLIIDNALARFALILFKLHEIWQVDSQENH